jgi:FkbM family methyltransferase
LREHFYLEPQKEFAPAGRIAYGKGSFVSHVALKLSAFAQIWRYFDNPLLVTLMRLGVVRLPTFSYRIQAPSGIRCTMLARPGTTSLADLFVLREVFIEETYADILPLLPKRAVTVLDVGANLGSFCVWLAARHGITHGTCFEPDPSSFRLCRFNLSTNGCTQVEPIPKAVGGIERTLRMRVNTTRPGGNSIYAAPSVEGETADVAVVPLAKWLAQSSQQIDVLKLDCEGAEWEVVDHTPAELWRCFSLIVAEIHGDPARQHQPEDFPKLMEARGFRTQRWDGGHMGLYIGVRQS